MACVVKMPKVPEGTEMEEGEIVVVKMRKAFGEAEMEEGEIVDELDDLSDISSEEEFLLRQRLEVLENYNNVLERKKAKNSLIGPGTKPKRDILCDLSEVSAAEVEDPHTHVTYKNLKVQRHIKPHIKQKRRKEPTYVDENNVRRKKDNQKKKTSHKKKNCIKVISESSDESEDEYRNKRKKLADAVIVNRKADKSSLSARLHKMIHWSEAHIHPISYDKSTDTIASNHHPNLIEALSPISSVNADDPISIDMTDGIVKDKKKPVYDSIEVSTDDDDAVKIINDDDDDDSVKIINDDDSRDRDKVKELRIQDVKESKVQLEKDSDEDLELLRQHALKSKPTISEVPKPNKNEQKPLSEDEDSDTAELRLICLKSALLKKAIERKQKKRLQKKLSQSSNLEDDLFKDVDLFSIKEDDNNTDIESMDMDIGSDAEEKIKDCNLENERKYKRKLHDGNKSNDLINCAINNIDSAAKEDELDDDEDLLRAKLLTSLSKNLTNLVNPEVLKTIDEVKGEMSEPQTIAKSANAPEAKKFIIKLDESDSEAEHEATTNLTKMHVKLSEQIDFQQKLDQFLKSTRQEVEKSKLPDVVQKPAVPNKPNKFVAKAVNHLPKSEQIEYKNLVRRMAELEKMKQTRQATLNFLNQQQHVKDMLKPRNVTIDTQVINNLETQIARSRKTIAEESVKMLKLKEEATKLSQRYKIAATELRNIGTAITLNKKQQRAIQVSLSKIRLQHQLLLNSSTTSLHSKLNSRIPHLRQLSNKALSNKLQKENNPKDEQKQPHAQKAVKISVVKDFVDKSILKDPRLSIHLDVTSNKKIVKKSNSDGYNDTNIETNHITEKEDQILEERDIEVCRKDSKKNTVQETEEESSVDTDLVAICDHGNKRYYLSVDDYKSPLDALGSTTWQADPNAILCPFEVDGQCKDPDCKYLHTPTPAQ